MYRLIFSKKAKKFIFKREKKEQRKIIEIFEILQNDP